MAAQKWSARRRWHLVLCAAFLLAISEPAWAQDGQRKVLVLYSTGRDAAIAAAGERELPRILDRGLGRRLDYYAEHLDTGRFPDAGYQAGYRDFLRLKYQGLKFDIVIGILDTAIEFLERYRAELFPDTPVVFFAQDPVARQMPNSTGVIAEVDFAATVTLATALQPDVTEVFVVSGAADRDRASERRAREQFRRFQSQLTFTYLAGLPTKELGEKLASLPPRSVVFYLLVYRDGQGDTFQPLDYLDRIARLSNRPIYSWVDSTMGRGVVGGSMQRLEAQIDVAAERALRVLRGEPADSIPTTAVNLTTTEVDWREIQRWGISEARIPAGTSIRFREPGLWERYQFYVLGAGVIMLAQAALIAGLLVQAARRRRAEAEVERNQSQLRTSSERIRDLGRRLLHAQEIERSRIARELHDDVGGQLTLLGIDLQMLARVPPGREDDRETLTREALDRVDGLARSVHDLSHRLHPAKLRLIGLVPALTSLVRELTRSDITLTFAHENVPASLPHDLTLCLFRVVQEALQNAIKHSGAHHISIRLRGNHATLVLTIVDDGAGFDVDAAWGKGLGLVSMTERLQSIGGTLTITSTPRQGTRLEATVPVPADRSQAAEPVAV